MTAWECANCGETVKLNDGDEPPLPCLVCDSDAWQRVDEDDVVDEQPVATDGGGA